MHIRLVDLWVVKEKTGTHHLEMVIQDGKEHETYYLYNDESVINDGPFKVCSNQLKLLFNGGTTVTNMEILEILPHTYNCHPIEKFLNGCFKYDMLYDVIDILQDVLRTQMGGGGKKLCANITLHDVEGNVIEVAFWDDHGKQFLKYTTTNKVDGRTIIILTHAW
ncbi:hypothetical protein RYX36_003968, partial [Vicia faba]